MLCQECGKKPATVHYTKIVNNQKTEYHMCEQCAREKGELDLSFGFDPGFSIHNLLAGLLDMDVPGGTLQSPSSQIAKCPTCGLSYSEFSRSGRLGCSDCYDAFTGQLEPLLRRIQGSTSHTGKVPERTGGIVKLDQEVRKLTQELQAAVDAEEFEQAASLRDRIREIKRQLEEGQGGKE